MTLTRSKSTNGWTDHKVKYKVNFPYIIEFLKLDVDIQQVYQAFKVDEDVK